MTRIEQRGGSCSQGPRLPLCQLEIKNVRSSNFQKRPEPDPSFWSRYNMSRYETA